MSMFVDTSVFALNIATGLSLGLAVDYALLMVSRYREEMGRDGPTREAHRRTVLTAGRTALFSGLTVAAAMAALVVLPQRFLYSIAVAGASVGVLSAMLALLVVPSLLALLGTRIDALSIRRGPAVSDESDGWYRLARGVMRHPVGVALASTGLLLAAAVTAALDDADRPERRSGAPGRPLLRSLQIPRRPLPARRHRGGHGHRRRAAPATPNWRASAPDRSARRRRPGHTAGARLRRGRLRQLRLGEAGARPRARRTPSRRSARSLPRAARRRSSPATPPASSTRSRACSTTCRWSSGSSPRPR